MKRKANKMTMSEAKILEPVVEALFFLLLLCIGVLVFVAAFSMILGWHSRGAGNRTHVQWTCPFSPLSTRLSYLSFSSFPALAPPFIHRPLSL